MIKNVFITFGEIKSVEIPLDHESCTLFCNIYIIEKNRGFAFIEFEEIEDAE